MKENRKWVFIVIVMLVCLNGCGSKVDIPEKVSETQPAAPTATIAPTPEADEAVSYCGTWAPSGIKVNDVDFTIEQAAAMGIPELKELQIVLADGDRAFISTESEKLWSRWHTADDCILLDNAELGYVDDGLVMDMGDGLIYLEKVSDDQVIPEPEAAADPTPAPTEAITAPEPEAVSGIRPEFKDAMDSYEAFYDEYCNFMEEYAEDPTDFTLLVKYAEMLSKASEMDEKFNAWDQSDMTNEELKYYLDVTNRIQSRLIDLF